MEKYTVTGMSCAACSARVEKAVSVVPGVTACSVNLLTNSMTVEGSASPAAIVAAVENAGYGAAPETAGAKENATKAAEKAADRLKTRLILSVIILVPLMWIAMGHMLGFPIPGFLSGGENALNMALAQLILSGAIIAINYKYFTNGFKNLFRLAPNMDSLIAIGAGASYIYGIYVTAKIASAVFSGEGKRHKSRRKGGGQA